MAKISAEEKQNATLITLNDVLSSDDDTEAAFNDFRASFDTGDEPGVVRAWKLQIDERGNIGTTKAQTRLGAWPVDAYTLDELCQLLVNEFMEPGQDMAVRLVGTKRDQSGYKFNKIIMLKRALKKESSSAPADNTASMMKALSEMNERNMEMFRRLQPAPAEKPDGMADLQKLIAVSAALNGPMMTMMQALLPALAGRPPPAAGNGFESLSGLLDVVEKLDGLRGGGGGGGGNDDGWAGILRAVTPLAKPALEAIPALAAMQAANRPAPRILAPPTPAPRPAPAPNPSPAPAPTGAPMQPTDLPSEDSNMLAQLKPQIDSLVAMAAQGSDATGAADLIFDQVFLDPRLPDDVYEKLADFIDSEKFTPYVIIMNPGAKPHAAWFDAFKARVIQRMAEEEAADEQPTGNGTAHHPV